MTMHQSIVNKNGMKFCMTMLALSLLVSCGKKDDSKSVAGGSDAVIVKIGNGAPLTGGDSYLGKDNENGARLAVEEINQKGLTINGKKVTLELLGEDDAGDPKQGTQIAQKLVDSKVVAVVGHLNSGVSIPASKIYNEAGIAQITPSSTNPELTNQNFNNVFRLVGTDAQQGPTLALYVIEKLNGKKIALVDDSTQYGKGLIDEFEKAAKAKDAHIVLHEATNNKATDFKAILTNIKAKNPDVIVFGGMAATGGLFAKQAKELGIKAKIVGGDGICSPTLYDLAGEAVSNVICSTVGVPKESLKDGGEFLKKYKERFGVEVQIYSPMAYDAVMIIVEAMKKANSTMAADILKELPNTNYEGISGQVSFDSKGDLKNSAITLNEYKNNKISTLEVMRMQ
ncbi:branched-chain amino acid ABC transporter substrate-binding protein [Polynucleobacter rarus]|uniref:branched-chain amino acid ABC transporter substrate-binding protein n=1 Tax=Polynucleobacter rarus TaxID=556055 RepID=UPI000D3EAD07|nr:branched-chain amino acid ABC transporter substrate-binding protein [Polynucleobacter rarus]